MSNKNKFSWFMVILWAVITIMVFWLIMSRSERSKGLECVYNCSGYNEVLQGLK